MDKKTAIDALQERWEKRLSPDGEIEKLLTTEGRIFKNFLKDTPYWAINAVINGISITEAESKVSYAAPKTESSSKMLVMTGVGLSCVCTGIICALFKFPPVLSTFLTTGIAVYAASFLMNKIERENKRVQPVRHQAKTEVKIDSAAIDKALDVFQGDMARLLKYVRQQEEERTLGFDITESKSFGDWVQKFADYCNRNIENHDLNGLRGELFSKLGIMGIEVYDTLEHDSVSGKVILPDRTWFKDERSTDDADFTTVKHAAVISRRRVLAIGTLK